MTEMELDVQHNNNNNGRNGIKDTLTEDGIILLGKEACKSGTTGFAYINMDTVIHKPHAHLYYIWLIRLQFTMLESYYTITQELSTQHNIVDYNVVVCL